MYIIIIIICSAARCRWVGNNGAGGDPSIINGMIKGSSFWACHTDTDTYAQPTDWTDVPKCTGKNDLAGGAFLSTRVVV